MFVETIIRSIKLVALTILQSIMGQKQKELLCQSVVVIILTV